jgi:hypothetical protein
LLYVFQSVDLQNLIKFRHQEGHQFEYQSVDVSKS